MLLAAEHRIVDYTKEYRERLDYELSVIHQMGFDDYFLDRMGCNGFCS